MLQRSSLWTMVRPREAALLAAFKIQRLASSAVMVPWGRRVTAFSRKIPGYLEEWREERKMDEGNEEFQKTMEYFRRLRESLSEAELDALERKDKDFRGHYEDRVFLQYLGRHCKGLLKWKLPEGHRYRVEVIDVWNMTRETVLEGAGGDIEVKLPGREGMAVLAVET